MYTSEQINQTIADSFKSLKFKPRGFQPEVIFKIVDAFLNKNMQNVVCSLDTGAGKSIIGAVVADVVDRLTPNDGDLASVITMGQNVLSKQYLDTFKGQGKHKYFQIMGASNYDCNFLKTQPMVITTKADDCLFDKLTDELQEKYCSNCEYAIAKKTANQTDNLITNNAYFLIANLMTHHLLHRKMHVFDEAHNLNEAFCNFAQIDISVDLIDKYIKELGTVNGKCDDQIAGLIMFKDKIKTKEIGLNNYSQYLDVLKNIYTTTAQILSMQAMQLKFIDVVQSGKYDKMSSKYDNLRGKIYDLFKNEYDHVFDDSIKDTISIKTIFVGKMMSKLLAKYNLFMSATITKQFVFDTLDLEEECTEYIDTPPVFPSENKPLFFIGKRSLNYEAMKDKSVIEELKNQVKLITDFHKEDSGLIIVPSFYLGSQLAHGIKSHKVFEHKSGTKIGDIISNFKNCSIPAVLVSPSIFEGLSFDGDKSRFQLICKTPYPSLGDRRIKHIADNYPDIYKEMTLLKIIQGIGRSVRSESDWANTYFLDQSSKKLFDSKLNIWKPRFTVQT